MKREPRSGRFTYTSSVRKGKARMDTLTHLVAGALTPLAFPGAPKRAAVLGFGIAVGELPDIDIFFGTTPEALMVVHRGITHALVWQPLMALLAVIPFYLWLRCKPAAPVPIGQDNPPYRESARFGLGSLYLVALFAVYTHIYLDCMTTFGTQIFLPFSAVRVAFPSMFIVDLLLTLPALGLMVYAWRLQPEYFTPASDSLAGPRAGARTSPAAFASARARRIARIGLAWMLVYPLVSLGVNAAVTAVRAPFLAPGASLRLLTEPFSPFVWKAVVEKGRVYRMATLFPASANEPYFQTFVQPEPMLYETLKRQHPIFRQFEDFAPMMVQMDRPTSSLTQAAYEEKITEYAFADLRYLMSPDSPARFFGRSDPNFILEARINDSGALLAYRFLRRGKLESTPWTLLQ